MGNYRTSPVWNQARHLVLSLSVAADSFQSPGLSKKIRNQSVHLLLQVMQFHEAKCDRQSVNHSIDDLQKVLIESHKKGFLTKTAFGRLKREVGDLQSALKEASVSAGSLSAPPSVPKKYFLSSSTGALS